jgi:hypothetical protein
MTYEFRLGKIPNGEEIFLTLQLSPEESVIKREKEMEIREKIRAVGDRLKLPDIDSFRRKVFIERYNDFCEEGRDLGMVVPHLRGGLLVSELSFL